MFTWKSVYVDYGRVGNKNGSQDAMAIFTWGVSWIGSRAALCTESWDIAVWLADSGSAMRSYGRPAIRQHNQLSIEHISPTTTNCPLVITIIIIFIAQTYYTKVLRFK